MNNHLQKCLSELENLIGIQSDSVIRGDPSKDYMHGMLNGLICAHSVFTKERPRYYSGVARKKRTNIRHKSRILRKARFTR